MVWGVLREDRSGCEVDGTRFYSGPSTRRRGFSDGVVLHSPCPPLLCAGVVCTPFQGLSFFALHAEGLKNSFLGVSPQHHLGRSSFLHREAR